MSAKSTFKLVPRWVVDEDILRGWVVLHRDITDSIGLRHLSHAVIRCVQTNKKIFCRVFGPSTVARKGPYYKRYTKGEVQESIFLDAYYLERLGLSNDAIENKSIDFEIVKGGFLIGLKACLDHPEDGIRVGMHLGVASVYLSFVAILIALFN